MKKFIFCLVCLIIISAHFAPAKQIEKKRFKVKIPKGFVFIPQGNVTIDSDVHSIAAFIMSKHEVTNKQYRIFLNDLWTSGRLEDYAIAIVDTSVWNFPNSYCEPMKVHYFNHPAYDNYPVVGISYEGAVLYCKWLTEQMKKEGYTFQFYLPQHTQWVYAASGGFQLTDYPWPGFYLRDSKGNYLCNYKIVGDESISYTSSDGTYQIQSSRHNHDGVLFQCIVGAYPENAFGLFDMSGNVAEMTSEKGLACGGSWNSTGYDVRIFSTSAYNKADAFTGFRPVAAYISR